MTPFGCPWSHVCTQTYHATPCWPCGLPCRPRTLGQRAGERPYPPRAQGHRPQPSGSSELLPLLAHPGFGVCTSKSPHPLPHGSWASELGITESWIGRDTQELVPPAHFQMRKLRPGEPRPNCPGRRAPCWLLAKPPPGLRPPGAVAGGTDQKEDMSVLPCLEGMHGGGRVLFPLWSLSSHDPVSGPGHRGGGLGSPSGGAAPLWLAGSVQQPRPACCFSV